MRQRTWLYKKVEKLSGQVMSAAESLVHLAVVLQFTFHHCKSTWKVRVQTPCREQHSALGIARQYSPVLPCLPREITKPKV